jgi:phosphoribosyl 1,2-cyclic phosphodiesterase
MILCIRHPHHPSEHFNLGAASRNILLNSVPRVIIFNLSTKAKGKAQEMKF